MIPAMRLSSKAQYGLLALLDLALFSAGQPLQASQIAERQAIPKQYLDQLMMDLKRGRLVVSARGRQGGYQLARPAGAISLWDVIAVFEGPLCDSPTAKPGSRSTATREVLKHFWDEACSRFATGLKGHTLEEICRAYRHSMRKPTYQI